MSKTASLFSKQSEPEQCPDCGAELVIRNGQHGPFIGCSCYPACEFVRPLTPWADSRIVTTLKEEKCPLCQAALVVRTGKYGMFISCADYPDCHYIGSLDQANETEVTCPQCQSGKLLQRKSRYGKIFYGCSHYPKCQFVINHLPKMGECEYCHYPLLIQKKTVQGSKVYCANKACGKPAVVNDI